MLPAASTSNEQESSNIYLNQVSLEDSSFALGSRNMLPLRINNIQTSGINLPRSASLDHSPGSQISDFIDSRKAIQQERSSMSPPGSGSRQAKPSNSGVVSQERVSEKIQKLVNTLMNPKRSSLIDFYRDEDDQLLPKITVDANAPQPCGVQVHVTMGDQLIVPSGLPKNLECAVQQFSNIAEKQSAFSCVQTNNNKLIIKDTITFAKFEKISMKIAYLLSDKLLMGPNKDFRLAPRDRVALLYASNEPIQFISAFYGCLMASLIPIAIEVPSSRRAGSSKSMGFLLNSLEVKVVLTSDQCFRGLHRSTNNEEIQLPGWPSVFWVNVDNQVKDIKIPKDWNAPLRLDSNEPLYIEYAYSPDGTVRGISNSRQSALEHCRALTAACSYTESDVMVCVVDNRREAGLWHAVLTSVFNGIHVIFVPHAVMQQNPGAWLQVATRHHATVAIVRGRDMQWGILAESCHSTLNLSSLRMILVTDGANPWTLNMCEAFVKKFMAYGLAEDVICPEAHSSEALTVTLRRPLSRALSLQRIIIGASSLLSNNNNNQSATNAMPPVSKGILSMYAMSFGKILMESTSDLSSLTLTDCGIVLPGTTLVTVRVGADRPVLCRTDEIGEICISSSYTSSKYWNLDGASKARFFVEPVDAATNQPIAPGRFFTRTGLLGFPGPPMLTAAGVPSSLVFICGSLDGLMTVEGRRHNSDDLVATILAIPGGFIFRSRVCAFSLPILRDERIVVVAELREDCSDSMAFFWMSNVMQTIEHIHHDLSIYCIALVPQNGLPKTPFGGISVHEVRRLFQDGSLHPSKLLLCPHSSIRNLPLARTAMPMAVGPSAMMLGQVIQGSRFAEAQGRNLNVALPGCVPAPGATDIRVLPAIFNWRAEHTPQELLFTVFKPNPRVSAMANQQANSAQGSPFGHVPVTTFNPVVAESATAGQLYSRVELIKSLLVHKAHVSSGQVVAVMYQPGVELIAAFYACQLIGAIPVVVRPPTSASPISLMPGNVKFDPAQLASGRDKGLRRSFAAGDHSQGSFDSPKSMFALKFRGSNAGMMPPERRSFANGEEMMEALTFSSSEAGSSSSLSSSMGNLTKCCLSRANHARFTLESSLETAYSIIVSSKASAVLTGSNVMKFLKSKAASAHIPVRSWPNIFDTEDSGGKRKPVANISLSNLYNNIAYIDFNVSSTGTLTGVEMTHAQASAMCHAMKLQCEFYPAMKVLLTLEPYSGLALTLWTMTSIYCGHHSLLVPPSTLEVSPDLWLVVAQQEQIRDVFLSYAVMELCLFRLAPNISRLKRRELNMSSLRSVVALAEERPRASLTSAFTKVFSCLGLNARAVTSSFSCRNSLAVCLQGSTNPDLSTVYVDKISLRNDRIKLVERGSPNSICLQESGKLLPGVKVIIANPDTLGECSDSQLGEIWIYSPFNCKTVLGPFQMVSLPSKLQDKDGQQQADVSMNGRNSSTTATSSVAGTQSSTASSLDDLRNVDDASSSGLGGRASSVVLANGSGVQASRDLPTSGVSLAGFGCANRMNARLATGSEDALKQNFVRSGFLGFVKRTDRTEADGHLHDALFVVGSVDEAICLRGMRYHPIDIENSILRAHKKICQSAVFTSSNLLIVVAEMFGDQDHEALDLIHSITARVLEDHQLIVGVVVVVDPGTIPLSPQGDKLRIHLRDLFLVDGLNPIYVSYNI